jgi:hypothetical protein
MILVKGQEVVVWVLGPTGRNRKLVLSPSLGIIHDQGGTEIRKCEVFVGPFTTTKRPARMTGAAAAYFGERYDGRIIKIGPRPRPEAFRVVGPIVQVNYVRRGRHRGLFFHPFKLGVHPVLSRSGRWYRITLDNGNQCIYNDRGFVFP